MIAVYILFLYWDDLNKILDDYVGIKLMAGVTLQVRIWQ